jgi:hypothetical protein
MPRACGAEGAVVMYERHERRDVRPRPGSCVVFTCAVLSCTPVALGGEEAGNGGGAEGVGEGAQAVVAATDVYDVVAFGADPASGGQDDQPAIMAAIQAATAARGGIIHFPRGEYDVAASIVLPRSYTKPLILQGDGRYVSLITTLRDEQDNHLLPSSHPVIEFDTSADPSTHVPSKFYGFRDLQISRRNDGHVFRHTLPSPEARLLEAVFERVIFLGANDPDGAGGAVSSTDLVHIQGGLLCTMSDVTFGGGNTGLVIEASSHMSLRDSGTNSDHECNSGIRLIGGGSHSLHHTRIEACDGGTALSIEGGATGIGNIQIDGLFGEGKRTRRFIDLRGSAQAPVENIVMKGIHVPTPWGPGFGVNVPSYGLYIGDHVHNLRVLGGTFSTWGTNLVQNGGQPIHVDAGARNIELRMATDDHVEQGGIDDYAAVEPGARRVQIELIDGAFRPYLRSEGMIEAWTVEGKTAYVGAAETVRAAPHGTITTILQAHTGAQDSPPQAGQRVLLLGTSDTSVLVSNSGNLRLSTLKFHLYESAVIQLVYDGVNWQEVSRSVN